MRALGQHIQKLLTNDFTTIESDKSEVETKDRQMKAIKHILILFSAVGLLAGCASQGREGTGALGNDSETSAGSANHPYARSYLQPPTVTTGPNGMISPSNPLGHGGAGTMVGGPS